MFDEFFDFLDTFVTYLQHLSLSSIVNTYWFLIFIELPRYYIVEYAVMFHINLHQKRIQKLKKFARFRLYKDNPLISVIVPGKNEGQHIYKLVKSLAEQTYRNYEVIIIDDGSDDLTPYICADLEKAHLIDKYIRMDVRGGKASAANMRLWLLMAIFLVLIMEKNMLMRVILLLLTLIVSAQIHSSIE